MAVTSDFFDGFVADVRRSLDVRNLATFWECEPALRRLIDGEVIAAWINIELGRLTADEHYQGDWLTNEVVVHRDEVFELTLSLFDVPGRYIHALPFLGMYVPLQAPITYDRYQLPPGYRNDVFDPSLRLIPDGAQNTAPLQIFRIESDRHAYDLRPMALSPVLRFATRPVRPLEWLFSRSTLQAWQANDADLSFTQLRVGAYVLGKIAHQSSIEPLRRLANHPHHAVRWAAIQNLGRLNRSEALIKIREAVRDPHPHVRRAAQKTLDRLEGKAERPE